jgi:LCP family protein required for cell wall assembly
MRKLPLLLLIFVFTAIACNYPGYNQNSPVVQAGQTLITADPNATATPTPFQPSQLTPTANTTLAVEITPDTDTTAGTLTRPANTVTLLVLGSDWRVNSGYRTDVMIFVVLNTDTGAVSMTSFPRDLYVEIPGLGQERINTAQQYGGFSLTQSVFQSNFGITPDYYVMTNFQGFTSIIDSLGGIEVDASQNLTDTCKLPTAVNGYCSFGPGKVFMDGDTALWYVRSRYSSSDFDRTRREQEVLTAVFKKLMSLNAITKIPTLYQQFSQNVETDLPLEEVVKLATYAPGIIADTSKIHRYAIGTNEVWHYVTPGGAQVLLPNPDLISPILAEALHVK